MGTALSTRRIINDDGTDTYIHAGLTESQKRAKTKRPQPKNLESKPVEPETKKKTIKVKDFLRK